MINSFWFLIPFHDCLIEILNLGWQIVLLVLHAQRTESLDMIYYNFDFIFHDVDNNRFWVFLFSNNFSWCLFFKFQMIFLSTSTYQQQNNNKISNKWRQLWQAKSNWAVIKNNYMVSIWFWFKIYCMTNFDSVTKFRWANFHSVTKFLKTTT